ncbi:unnamed protein product [Rotaria sp. Silwood1]|nr:unnamed protein product [Rotaria sp. Silwood1]
MPPPLIFGCGMGCRFKFTINLIYACGTTKEHCEKSTIQTPDSDLIANTRDGDCRICGCEPDFCCSSHGYCGKTKQYCEKSSTPTPDFDLIANTRIGDCRICGCGDQNMCCSEYGYCGNTTEYCQNQKLVIDLSVDDSALEGVSCEVKAGQTYKIFSQYGFLQCKPFSTSIDEITVVLWPESETNDQEWQFLPVDENKKNLYVIQCMATQKVLTVGKQSNSFSQLRQWPHDSEDVSQQFKITRKDGDLCVIQHVQTNQTMTINNSNTHQHKINEIIVGFASQSNNQNGGNLWMLSETETITNSHWSLFINNKTGYRCVDRHLRQSSISLTLTDCLQWCESRKQKFCMWNYLSQTTQDDDSDDEEDKIFNTTMKTIVSSCWGMNKCKNRTLIENEKYHIYEYQSDDPSIEETLSTINDTKQSVITLDAYIAYTKYLLLEANDFQLNSESLMCIDLDPHNKTILTFENSSDGIRLCDLCPNLPPFDKLFGVIINQVDNAPLETKHNIKFDDCFMECVDNKQCIGYSYSETNKTCLTFNSMRASDDRLQLAHQEEKWTTVSIKQPTGVIQDWIYIRNTRIFDNGNQSTTRTFLQCLQLCRSTIYCSSMTYHFSSELCELFNKSDNEIVKSTYLSYGYISAINFEVIYGNNSNLWRFVEEENKTDDDDEQDDPTTKDVTLCELSNNTSSDIQTFYNPDCFTSSKYQNRERKDEKCT